MRATKLIALSVIAWALLLGPATLDAQESTTRGFHLGLHGSGASLSIEGQDRSNAGGGGVTVGVGLNRRLTLLLQVDGAQFDEASTGDVEGDWTMGHVDLGVRFYFANSLSKWVPYLQGALGWRVVSVSDPIVNNMAEEEVAISGVGVSLGGGLDYYFNPSLALDVQLLWTGGEFSTFRINNITVSGFDVDAQSTRFNIGINWWP